MAALAGLAGSCHAVFLAGDQSRLFMTCQGALTRCAESPVFALVSLSHRGSAVDGCVNWGAFLLLVPARVDAPGGSSLVATLPPVRWLRAAPTDSQSVSVATGTERYRTGRAARSRGLQRSCGASSGDRRLDRAGAGGRSAAVLLR